MNFNVLKTKALSKNQMRAIKGGSGTCGYKSPTGTVKCGVSKAQAMHMATAATVADQVATADNNGLLLNRRICLINCSPIHLSQP
mgnify:CR=1 FL=1